MSVWEYLMRQDQGDLMFSKVQKPFLEVFANLTCPFFAESMTIRTVLTPHCHPLLNT